VGDYRFSWFETGKASKLLHRIQGRIGKLLIPPLPGIFLGHLFYLANDNIDQLSIPFFYFQDINIRDPLVILIKG
jgi:hypothetical protein